MKRKYEFHRMSALFLAVLTVFMILPLSAGAEDSWTLSELKSDYEALAPIPLLIVKINYDADGDGVDAYAKDIGADKIKQSGEQWTHSPDSYWNALCFADTGKSLKTYYKKMTGDAFYFYPAVETWGTADDGVITVTIPHQHPQSKTGSTSTEDYASRIAALKATDPYVDYAAFDKNGDGVIDYTELAIVYVCGGYEYSSAYRGSSRDQFAVHAHYTSGSGCEMDGVMVQKGGASGFVRVGEATGANSYLTFGTLAHELGHFLGAADLYDTGTSGTKWNYAADMTLMASGSHNGTPSGTSPAYMDPFHMTSLGFTEAQTALDGTYTLYSRRSEKGAYNILKINTPDPGEYYLVENRYGASSDAFDAIADGARGIVIWHIDEYSINLGKINNASSGHDPGVVVMGVNSLSWPYGFYFNEGAANKNYYTFESGRYRFPVSGTAYTTLTEEQAAEFGLKIEILSAAGDEMQIKVTGAAVIAPTVHFIVGEKTTSSLTASARIVQLNGSNVTACGFILSSKSDYKTDPNAKTVYLKPDEYGKFSYTFEGLEENTKYFCTLFTEGSGGRHEKLNYGYTASTPVPRDYYIAHLYMGKSEAERSYDVRLKPGDTIPDAVTKSMKKNGYLFAGWYLDETYTERFDLNSTQTEIADFTLFAKWVEASSAAVLTIHGATSRYGMTFASEVGSTFAVPDVQPKAGYTLEGWYTDEALTIPYDFGMVIEDNDGLDLYAKWTKDEPEPPVETTGPADTTVPPETTNPGGTTTGNETETVSPDGGNVGLILVIAVVAVMAAGTVIYILLRKRQKN